jgi:glucose dehydrogenase
MPEHRQAPVGVRRPPAGGHPSLLRRGEPRRRPSTATKVFFGTLDAGIAALNKDTGKVVWTKKWGDHKVGYTMTGAPFVDPGPEERQGAAGAWFLGG